MSFHGIINLITRDWNNLSPEIRNSGNINIFKRKIKILLEKVPFYFGWGDRKLNIIREDFNVLVRSKISFTS
jgi:hypothetical protein